MHKNIARAILSLLVLASLGYLCTHRFTASQSGFSYDAGDNVLLIHALADAFVMVVLAASIIGAIFYLVVRSAGRDG